MGTKRGLGDGLCRHGCGENETMDHVFHRCTVYTNYRSKTRALCRKLHIDMTTANIMTDKRLQFLVEENLLDSIGLTKLKRLE